MRWRSAIGRAILLAVLAIGVTVILQMRQQNAAAPSSASDKPIAIVIDGKPTTFPTRTENGILLVPTEEALTSMGADVRWGGDHHRPMRATNERHLLQVTVDSAQAYRDEGTMTLQAPAKLIDGKIYVSLTDAAEAIGASIEWEDSSATYHIQSPTPPDEAELDQIMRRMGYSEADIQSFNVYAKRDLIRQTGGYGKVEYGETIP